MRRAVPAWDGDDAGSYRLVTAFSVDRNVLDGEALGLKGVDEPADLPGIARLAFDVDRGVLGRQVGEDALVMDLDDIDLIVGEQFDHRVERAGPVLELDAQPGHPPRE